MYQEDEMDVFGIDDVTDEMGAVETFKKRASLRGIDSGRAAWELERGDFHTQAGFPDMKSFCKDQFGCTEGTLKQYATLLRVYGLIQDRPFSDSITTWSARPIMCRDENEKNGIPDAAIIAIWDKAVELAQGCAPKNEHVDRARLEYFRVSDVVSDDEGLNPAGDVPVVGDYGSLREKVVSGWSHFRKSGSALLAIKEGGLWEGWYPSFDAFLRSFDKSIPTVLDRMRAMEVCRDTDVLHDCRISVMGYALMLYGYSSNDRVRIWRRACSQVRIEVEGTGRPTKVERRHVREAIRHIVPTPAGSVEPVVFLKPAVLDGPEAKRCREDLDDKIAILSNKGKVEEKADVVRAILRNRLYEAHGYSSFKEFCDTLFGSNGTDWLVSRIRLEALGDELMAADLKGEMTVPSLYRLCKLSADDLKVVIDGAAPEVPLCEESVMASLEAFQLAEKGVDPKIFGLTKVEPKGLRAGVDSVKSSLRAVFGKLDKVFGKLDKLFGKLMSIESSLEESSSASSDVGKVHQEMIEKLISEVESLNRKIDERVIVRESTVPQWPEPNDPESSGPEPIVSEPSGPKPIVPEPNFWRRVCKWVVD